jgi:hypothetical protein
MNKYLILLTSFLALSACGGGSSESDSSVLNTSASSSASQQTNSTSNSDNSSQTDNSDSSSDDTNNEDNVSSNSEVIMTNLTIDQSFDLKTDFDLLIDAKISTGNVRAYLNICQSKVDSNKADYQNCILRKPIKNGELSQQVTLSRQDIALVAEIWLYDNNPEPLRYQWQYDALLNKQIFEIRY